MAVARTLTFADLLRRHRRAAGLSQEELAERAGVSRNGIGELERGLKRAPRRDTVTRLADALQLAGAERAAFEAVARGRSCASNAHATSATPAVPRHAAPLFVGRTCELMRLERFLTGNGSPLLLIGGEPGIGKSRLLREAAVRARAAGWTVLEGGCQRRVGQAPFAPLLEAMARHVAGCTPAELRVTLAGAAWLVRLLPELVGMAVVPVSQWTLPPEQERRLMFGAVARYLSNIARASGTLLVLDDLQWAGADALELLAALVSEVQSASGPPLLLLGAYRSTEVHANHSLAHLLVDLARDGLAEDLSLGPLAREEARQLLEGLIEGGNLAGRAALVDRLLERAGGMPFYLVSCARGAQTTVEQGAAAGLRDAAVPWDAAQSIRQRVAALPQSSQDVLSAAAVVGRIARANLMAATTELPEGELICALEAVCRARLMVESSGDAYQFAHDLIREVVEGDLSAARRRFLHRRIAEALVREPVHTSPATLAYHFERAGNRQRAVSWLERAAEVARHAGAFIEARDHLRHAMALAPDDEHVRLREQIGDSVTSDIGFQEYQAAYGDWRRDGAKNPAVGARLVRKMLFACLRADSVHARLTGEELSGLRAQAQTFADTIGDDGERWRLRVAARFPALWQLADQELTPEEAGDLQSLALAAAGYFEAQGDGESLSEVLDVYGSPLLALGAWDAVIEAAQRRLGIPGLSPMERGDAMGNIGIAHFTRGDYQKVLATARAALGDLQPSASPEPLLILARDAAVAAYFCGDWAALHAVETAMAKVPRKIGLSVMYLASLLVAMAHEDSTAADTSFAMLDLLHQPGAESAFATAGLRALREAVRSAKPTLINVHRTPGQLRDEPMPYFMWALMFLTEHGVIQLDALISAAKAYRAPYDALVRSLAIAGALASGENVRLAGAIDEAEAHGLIPHAARMRIVLAQRTGDRAQLERAQPVLERLGDRQFLRRLERVAADLP